MPRNKTPVKTHPQPPDESRQKIFISKYVNQSKQQVFQVTFKLGKALRQIKRPKVFLNLKEGVVSIRGNFSAHHTDTTDPKKIAQGGHHDGQTHLEDQQSSSYIPSQADPQASSDSEIEILEVRPARKRRYYDPGTEPNSHEKLGQDQNHSHSYYTESDLSSLEDDLNQALSANNTAAAETKPVQTIQANAGAVAVFPNLFIPPNRSRSPPPAGYRNIPPNLMNAIHREMNVVYDGSVDDEIEVIDKRIFSLQDPITRTKIRLPIKSTTCRHFECFDFFNFCLFHKLPPGIRGGLKRSLVLQSQKSRETEQLFLRQQQLIQTGKLSSKASELVYPQFSENGQMFFIDLFSRTPPLYKCPLCDEKFGLKQLYISDVFNFFVKTTPIHTTKIMLVENNRYKIVEEEKKEQENQEHEIVDLSGDEEEDSKIKIEKVPSTKQTIGGGSEKEQEAEKTTTESSKEEDEFNDNLDDFLSTIAHGDGSWENPMTLD